MTNYRPQRSWAKVMFLQLSLILLTGGVSEILGGVCRVGGCLKFCGGLKFPGVSENLRGVSEIWGV